MTQIKKYLDRKGVARYEFQLYVGLDPITGKQKTTRRRGFRSVKEAEIALNRIKLTVLTGEIIKKAHKTTFKEVYELWLVNYKRTVKESTWATTERIFELHILPIFADLQVEKVTTKQCQKAVEKWFSDNLVQFKRYLNYTTSVFEYAINMGLIDDNPTDHVIRPVNRNRKIHSSLENFYDKNELRSFLDNFKLESNVQGYTFFRLLGFSGLRKSEALVLEWSDIDFDKGVITVNKTQSKGDNNVLLVQTPKTEMSNRIVYVDQETINILEHWKIAQKVYLLNFGFNINNQNNLVFSNEHNEMHQPMKPNKWLESVIKKYHLKRVTPHGFRHTYATLAFEAGATVKAVGKQLGHSDYKTTMDIYTAVTKRVQNEVSVKIANYLDF